MPCQVTEEGFKCGPDPKPTDHECDLAGETVEIEFMGGIVYSATCSVCGREGFQPWDIW